MESDKKRVGENLTAEQYLEKMGIVKDNTVLIAFIDGVVRNPSLVELLEGYRRESCKHLFVNGVCQWCDLRGHQITNC